MKSDRAGRGSSELALQEKWHRGLWRDLCVRLPAPTVSSVLLKAVLVFLVYAMKEKVLWDGLAASKLFCLKYGLPHLVKSYQNLYCHFFKALFLLLQLMVHLLFSVHLRVFTILGKKLFL